ncbi:hypothetical protein [Nocardioides convexus]|uniref:hypothetical protein n=1 Tax=Nocardioides convexus TaxID=2712224 RepID=UPI0024184350|nr:hypothetical protein [Nocardioides convexus]
MSPLPAKPGSGVKAAMTVWSPGSGEARVALSATPSSTSTGSPRSWPSTENCTVPWGLLSPAATSARKVIRSPYVDGSALEDSVVVVATTAVPSITVWLIGEAALPV